MPGRPYWKGHVRLSLVTFPVQLFTAVETKEHVTLHQIHKPSGERIRYQKIVPELGPVPNEDIAKGYEFEKDQYVLIEDEDLKALKLESNHTIELVQFVDRDEIDQIYYEKPYFVVPERGIGEEAFRVVRDALKATGKVALGQVVLSGRERIASIKPCGRGLVLDTLRFADEVREVDDYFAPIGGEAGNDEQLELATLLIKGRAKPFEPERFKDHYQEALRQLVQEKLKGHVVSPAKAVAVDNVIDLTAALRRSLGQKADNANAPAGGPPARPAKPAAAEAAPPGKAKPRAAKAKAKPVPAEIETAPETAPTKRRRAA